jgi:hypothetical protein
VWTVPPLTSGLFVLAAFFRAAVLTLTLLANAFLLPVILVYAALLTSLFVRLSIFAGLSDALLASVKAAFFHSLIAISIVCHIFSPFW